MPGQDSGRSCSGVPDPPFAGHLATALLLLAYTAPFAGRLATALQPRQREILPIFIA